MKESPPISMDYPVTWEIVFVWLLVAATLSSFILEKVSSDVTAIGVFCILLLASSLPFENSLPDLEALLGVFANPAPLTVAAMFIISAALEACGLIERMAARMHVLARLGFRRFLFILIIGVAGVSAFVNNTPVVVVFLPVVLSLARQMRVPASKILIPLSYASIFGGVCTLVGTSTNVLASGLLEAASLPPLGMFELAAVGIPLLAVATLYLTFVGQRLLPNSEPLSSILTDEERKEFLTEAIVTRDSPLAGKSIRESGLEKTRGVHVLEIVRENEPVPDFRRKEFQLQDNDIVVLSCRPSGIAQTRSLEGLELMLEKDFGMESLGGREGSIVEGIIGAQSPLIGKTLRQANFRQRYHVVPLAIHRRGVNIREKIRRVPMEFGDTLLIMGTDKALEDLRGGDEIYLLDRPRTPSVSMQKRIPLVLALLTFLITTATLNWIPIAAGAVIVVGVLFASGTLKTKSGYSAIDWSILALIYGMLGLGQALQSTGASTHLAEGLTAVVNLFASEEARPFWLLAGLYLITTVLTETLSNNATIVLMAPIAISLGDTIGVDPRPFVVATCIAASASFSTPIGYQTNTYVYGIGGYRFTDFARVGIPLNLLYFSVSTFLIPQIWPF